MSTKSRWEILEEWIFDRATADEEAKKKGLPALYGDSFRQATLVSDLGLDPEEASDMIQSYLGAQRRNDSATLYVLKRKGRTSNSTWSVGHRTADAKMIGGVLFEDVTVKVKRAFEPDLRRLAEKNPRAAKYANQKIAAVVDGALIVLAGAVDAMIEEDDE